jgi:hypothetical protein
LENSYNSTAKLIVLNGGYSVGKDMYPPLIVDRKDPKWLLLEQVLTITTSRRTKQELAKQGITPVTKAGTVLRIALISTFFSVDCAYVIEELRTRRGLRTFAHIAEVPSADDVYRFMSRFDEERFVLFVSGVLNSLCSPSNRRKSGTILVDSTAITLDLNWFRRTFTKTQLLSRDFDWGYSHVHGHYIGYKLTLAVDYPSLKPLAILLHRGSPHDSPLFDKILHELKRRRIKRPGDLVVCDKGYYSYQNYVDGIIDFKIVPVIFSKKNFTKSKLLNKLSYPLSVFGRSDTRDRVRLFKRLVRKLVMCLAHQDLYQNIRSLIEDIFKLAKDAFSLKKFHRYTTRSVKKAVCLNVLLLGLVISLGFRSKKQLQQLAEW